MTYNVFSGTLNPTQLTCISYTPENCNLVIPQVFTNLPVDCKICKIRCLLQNQFLKIPFSEGLAPNPHWLNARYWVIECRSCSTQLQNSEWGARRHVH